MEKSLTIVLPAKNEAANLETLLPALREHAPDDARIFVVDDGSTDNTAEVCSLNGVERLASPRSMGNGAAIKRGLRATRSEYVMFMDADGQHRPEDIHRLLERLDEGFDMVVGSRGPAGHASIARRLANAFYNRLASWVTETPISDLTSGYRVVRAEVARNYVSLLPNGFSYPTTLTMAILRGGRSVCFVPITALQREGESHIRPLRDGVKFLLIIFRVGTLYSPLKLFAPISAFFFVVGAGYMTYTLTMLSRFTNMGAVLILVSIVVFLIGLISEQITALLFANTEPVDR
ncbi:MAG: glycosyltransferase family 2 protein [Xanthomonadales bacterium]|nr:glycosyltransferase family 2 protein [Xanthomonadales bacterium]